MAGRGHRRPSPPAHSRRDTTAGLAWLELIIDTDDQGRTVFRQRALFHPRGLAGHIYWAVIRPFHGVVFGGMQRNIARTAEVQSKRRTGL